MPPEPAKLLRDILDAVERITDYTRARSRKNFLDDAKLCDAVQWNFIVIIGEALTQLPKLSSGVAEQITEWSRIVGFRNQLIHGYGIIKNEITWDIIENKLAVLRSDVQKLLCQR